MNTDWKAYPPQMARHSLAAAVLDPFAAAMRTNRNRPQELMMLPADWAPVAMPKRAMVEEKHDGIHVCYVRGAAAPAFTREGSPFMAARHLRRVLDAIEGEMQRRTHKLHRLFGEYVHPDGFDAAVGDFQRGEGDGGLMLFDAVTDDAWRGKEISLPLIERRALLADCAAAAGAGVSLLNGGVKIVKYSLFEGEARDNIEIAAGAVWDLGGEGIVVKDADSPYIRARSHHWMRIKRNASVDLPIVDVDVQAYRVKAFMVEPKPGIIARIGRGISDALRSKPALFRVGRVTEIKHLGETKSGNLRSASFARFRDDRGDA